jgi:hypothetical protein
MLELTSMGIFQVLAKLTGYLAALACLVSLMLRGVESVALIMQLLWILYELYAATRQLLKILEGLCVL